MKTKYISSIGAALILATGLTACHDDMGVLADGQGRLLISTTINSDVKIQARSRAEVEDELAEKCLIYISNPKGLVRRYQGLSALPQDGIKLQSDHYVAEAWTGDSVSASYDKKWYKGREEFDIVTDQTTKVDLTCKIANVVTSVDYENTVDEVLKDYTLTVGHSRGTLDFEGRDERKGYFMMPSTDTDLTWTLNGTKLDGEAYTKTGTIENAKPATEYIIHIKHNGVAPEVGGAFLTIEIEEKEIVVEDEFTIYLAPQIVGYNFDIESDIMGESGNVGRKSILAQATSAIKSCVIESSLLTDNCGLSGNDVDLMAISDALVEQLSTGGVTFTYNYDAQEDNSYIKINFEKRLLDALANGTYSIKVTVTDANDKTATKDINIKISDAPVAVQDVDPLDIYATTATITGRIIKSDVTTANLLYRVKGATAWTTADTKVSGTSLSASLSSLTPGTTYEYTVATDEFTSNDTKTFTTEAAQQFENAGFENWSKPGTPYLLYGEGQSMYWDSGNHGSTTLGSSYNITTPESTIKHSGNYSAKLASRNVVIKLAAGNAFVGKYLATDGTDGVLGWGRPFTSRPKALKGYVKYVPGTVDKTSTSVPDIVSGQNDKGIIYFALLDDSKLQGDTSYPEWPVVIKTKSNKLFNKDSADVIAYGEIIWSEATEGDGLIEFTVPLTYKRTDAKPSYVVCACSASKGGDYFAGSTSSVMYVDDLEFVY
jgi:hypothetical protein